MVKGFPFGGNKWELISIEMIKKNRVIYDLFVSSKKFKPAAKKFSSAKMPFFTRFDKKPAFPPVKIILNVGIDVSNRSINASISTTTLEITP